tara:strand:+ start:44 stop:556 length:513 start_codon:yes stop_codon:yes gene_type:complete
MKSLFFSLLFLLSFNIFAQETPEKEQKVTTYYLIRHAEKDRTDKSNKNPDLTEAGHKRARNWATYFKDIEFDAVYSTDYNRTKQTVLPTAESNDLDIEIYNPFTIKIDSFLIKTKGKTVLIVGHSNTIPKFVNQLIGEEKYKDIADDNNANLYIVKIKEGKAISELKVIE